ncbi:MAG: cytochrome c3 family protein [Planctomycetota bacterium]|jgi:predicted CXXCH cytochrome family protein
MKVRKIVVVALCLAFTVSMPVWAVITGSVHDFSASGWSGGEICIVCHTPHGGSTVLDAPLWNHEQTTETFAIYGSSTLETTNDIGQPDGSTKLCLSCHDGSIALDSFGGATGSNFIDPNYVIAGSPGWDLGGEHPVSFTYDTALATADGGLHDPNTTTSGLGGTIAEDLLIGDKLQCSSCHDVHREDVTTPSLLVMSNTTPASGLCLTCHDK